MDKNNKYRIIRVLLLISLCCAAASVTVRTVLTATSLDSNYGLYASGDPLPVIFHILLACTCFILVLTAALKAPKLPQDHYIHADTFTVFASFVSTFLLAARVLTLLFDTAVNGYSPTNFDIYEICFAVISIIYFLGIALKSKNRSAVLAFTSFFPIGWCAVCLISIYFDKEVLMTSPNKILGLVSFLSGMIYFLCEARIQIAKVSHWFYLAAATSAPILLLTSSIPNIIFYETLRMGSSDNLMRYTVQAALGLFIYARLVSYTRTTNGTNGETLESSL